MALHNAQSLTRNSFHGMGWDELQQTLEAVTLRYIMAARRQPAILTEFHLEHQFVSIVEQPRGAHWLWLCSDRKLNWVPARIQLRHQGFEVWVLDRDGEDACVRFPENVAPGRGDLRYFEIGDIFTRLGRDAAVAREMLLRVQGGYNDPFGDDNGFIDSMVVLMFGVEASRNWSTCATSLMLLELVANQCTCGNSEIFTLAKAFHHESRMWDESSYDGASVAADGVGWDLDEQCNPRHDMVIYRELSVLRHWLRFTDQLHNYSQLQPADRILKLLQTYLA